MEELKSKKILAVDDEKDVLEYLSNILRRSKYEIITTTKGKEVFDLAKNEKPDLIILDILMGDMDGGEVAYGLSKDSATCNIPIIFLTALLTKEEDSVVEKTGTNYIVGKPVIGSELLMTIKKALSL